MVIGITILFSLNLIIMQPIISLITITFNSQETIQSTLDSIFNQSFQDFEHIIIDGGSSDNTLNIIENHDIKTSKLISEKDNGIYDALNKGIRESKGRYIGILHSDDIFFSNETLNLISKELISSEPDILYGNLKYTSRKSYSKIIRNWNPGNFSKYKLHLGWMPPHPSFYIKRSLCSQEKTFNTNFKISSDYDFMIRSLTKKNIIVSYIDECIVLMRLGGESNKSIKNLIIALKEDIVSMQNNKIFWPTAIILKKLSKLKQFL